MRLNTFDEVVSWYDRTKPVISANHTAEEDVRPLWERRYKWKRIKRINNNAYVLLDGYYGRTMWIGGSYRTPGDHAWENRMGPILWTREADGDYITVTNHTVGNHGYSRYEFLREYLPTGMVFDYSSHGCHMVRVRVSDNAAYQDFLLPKCDVRFDWARHELSHDDGKYLKFRVNGDGTFTRAKDRMTVTTRHIDREAKKQWGPKLEEFYQYLAVMAPLLDTSWSAVCTYVSQIIDWHAQNNRPIPRGYTHAARIFSPDIMRAVVDDAEHPLRVAAAVLVIREINGKRPIESQDDVREIRATYNRVMNKAMNFYKVEEI